MERLAKINCLLEMELGITGGEVSPHTPPHTPYTLLPAPHTLHILNPKPYTLHPTPYTLNPTLYTIHPKP